MEGARLGEAKQECKLADRGIPLLKMFEREVAAEFVEHFPKRRSLGQQLALQDALTRMQRAGDLGERGRLAAEAAPDLLPDPVDQRIGARCQPLGDLLFDDG